jgi:hypothetical protein
MKHNERKTKLPKKKIKVVLVECWDGSKFLCRPNIPGAKERLDRILAIKKVHFKELSLAHQQLKISECNKRMGGLVRLTIKEMDKAQYEKIELWKEIKDGPDEKQPGGKPTAAKENVQDKNKEAHAKRKVS